MFDRDTYIGVGVQHHTHEHQHRSTVTVNEHRAPTDESLRLLNETRAQLQRERLLSAVVDTNLGKFNCELYLAPHLAPHAYELGLAWSFNGVRASKIEKLHSHTPTPQWLADSILNAVQAVVAEALVLNNREALDSMLHTAIRGRGL